MPRLDHRNGPPKNEGVEFCLSVFRRVPGSRCWLRGSGSNLQALLDAYPRELVVGRRVTRKDAYAFVRARRAGVPVEHADPRGFGSREDYDAELAARISVHDVGLVVGAGYMRVLSSAFLREFPAILNVHPSLLPEFRGLDAVGRALEAGVDETGVTVHFMVGEVDAGAGGGAAGGHGAPGGYKGQFGGTAAPDRASSARRRGRGLLLGGDYERRKLL